LREQVDSLRGALRKLGRFGSFIGNSPQIQRVYDLISRVAPTDATVLITGETGTGKELVAQTIHDLSDRRRGPFRAVNCGAIARELIESELFGHEKGAFTGADRRRSGYFEQATGGSLVLDEITEMPLESQVPPQGPGDGRDHPGRRGKGRRDQRPRHRRHQSIARTCC